jgi:hypothetical protein
VDGLAMNDSFRIFRFIQIGYISFWFTKSKIKNLFSRCLDPQIGWNTFPENYLETLL